MAKPTSPEGLDVIIIGAGVGGLYAIHKYRQLGLKVRAYEKGDDVGGTWYWNRYPGCRCDVESLEYSFSFSPELDQEWKWPERYGNQGEILKYVQHVADRFDLRQDIQFNTTITSATFDDKTSRWTVTTDKGETITAPYCLMATGNLSTPRKPDIKGIDSYKGKTYHTGLWPHGGVDFTGLRVGVIGTGSSGVQSIPIIARQARQLTVFQRTANFSLPARNEPMDPQKEAKHKAEYPERRAGAVNTPFAIAGYPPPTKSALDVSAEERNAAYEKKWQEGGSISFLYAYTDLLTNKAANDTASDFVEGQGDRRGALPERSSDRHQAADPGYQLLRDLQSAAREAGQHPQQCHLGDYRVGHQDCGWQKLRARRHRVRHGLRRHDRRHERDRHQGRRRRLHP